MINPSSKKFLITIFVIVFLANISFVFAQDIGKLPSSGYYSAAKSNSASSPVKPKPKKQQKQKAKAKDKGLESLFEQDDKLSVLQKQARMYRMQGYQAQKRADLQEAASYYQKAIELDPNYAVVYNDLGVIYETTGQVDRAEENYLKALKIDPKYASSCSNLALLYESKRDLKNAALYWRKRADLGPADDPWVVKARTRYNDIRMALGEVATDPTEQEVLNLVKEVSAKKQLLRKSDKELSRSHLEKAKMYFQRGDEVTALKEATDAQQLDPANEKITEFIDKLRTRLLSK